jgi:acyl-CoA synthetase (AMP-forming)/AMP-acid ligase II
MRTWIASPSADALALIDADHGTHLTYGALRERVAAAAAGLSAHGRSLVFLAMDNSIDCVVLYLACLESDHPVVLLDVNADGLQRLEGVYRPRLLLLPQALKPEVPHVPSSPEWAGGHALWEDAAAPRAELHPDLALMLTTSGSTGNPKLVRLKFSNLEGNAASIANYLGITDAERPIASLPFYYSYGLSVLNSHFHCGACTVLTRHSFLVPEFWKQVDEVGCTSFAGIPYMYETLHRLRWTPERHPGLRTLTQAGGGLRPDLIRHFHERSLAAGVRFFVMYGQTEATARISYVPPERLEEKLGSIGIPIPGGTLSLNPVEDGLEEMVYRGPNVMMGYAESPADLARSDELGGVLHTGDLATMDADGYFRLVGRLKRFAKLFGHRISLEDVEQKVEAQHPVQAIAISGPDRIRVMVECHDEVSLDQVRHDVAAYLHVPPMAIEVERVERLPRTSAGKKDFKALE